MRTQLTRTARHVKKADGQEQASTEHAASTTLICTPPGKTTMAAPLVTVPTAAPPAAAPPAPPVKRFTPAQTSALESEFAKCAAPSPAEIERIAGALDACCKWALRIWRVDGPGRAARTLAGHAAPQWMAFRRIADCGAPAPAARCAGGRAAALADEPTRVKGWFGRKRANVKVRMRDARG